MVVRRDVVVYDGPRVLPKDYEQVLYPPRSANLQIPSPSNPGGAPHVILVDWPTVDEVRRLMKNGTYDLATKEDRDALENLARDTENQETEDQKDVFRGVEGKVELTEDKGQTHVTRLMCFDTFDIDEDGRAEDVIWTVIKELKVLVRAKHLTEVYPSNPPRRPFAEATFLPVSGRREGIGLLEMLEGSHDDKKIIIDQAIDAGTLANAPFGFYRQHGTMKPETIHLAPGELYPLGDPSKDIVFPQLGNRDQSFGLNMFTLFTQQDEKLSVIGDIQLGRVPPGRASALRTKGGLALLSGQGEARPERILRRLFIGFVEIWQQIHELNQHFLPDEKMIRISGVLKPNEDPYTSISSKDALSGRFRFAFKANVLNTSKEALQGSLLQLASIYINDLNLQLGLITPDGIYRLERDIGMALGQDPDSYLSPPSEESLLPRIFAEEALSSIFQGVPPEGTAAEPGGYAEHLQKLIGFVGTDELGLFGEKETQLLRVYIQKVQEKAQAQQRQQAAVQAAGQFRQQLEGGDPGGRPPEGGAPNMQNPPVQGAELLDESLPGAGGGGAQTT